MQLLGEEMCDGSKALTAHPRMENGDYPETYVAAEAVSASGQTWHKRALLVELVAYFLAALTNSITLLLPFEVRSQLIGLTIFLLVVAVAAPLVRRRQRFDRQWFEARAVAESIKTATWRYMMKATPLETDATADEELTHTLAQVRHADGVLPKTHPPARTRTITDRMREVRSWEWERRRLTYIDERLDDQIHWYGRKARYNARWADWLFHATNVARLLAIGSVALRVAVPEWNFLPVFIALAASALAWTQAKRFDELEKSYLVARQELSSIKKHAHSSISEQQFLSHVTDGENAISREHTMWVVRRTDPPAESVRDDEGAVR